MGKARASHSHVVDATILFIDLMESVSLSNVLTLTEYNALINDYQDTLRRIVEQLKQRYPIGEYYIQGDQLAAFFYAPDAVAKCERMERLRQKNPASPTAARLEAELELQKNRCLYGALRCAVQAKNAWTSHPRNVARINAHQPVQDVGVGINTGNVIQQLRADGQTRIEGFAINLGKRVEGFSRYGTFCKIMLSKTAYETFRNTIVGHTMLKQRAFFEPYSPHPDLLKGLQAGTRLYELKFFHRLAGFSIPLEQVQLYARIFKADPTNFWAYTNLINYHHYEQSNTEIALEIAHHALYSNPQNEKVYYDLANINLIRGEYETAREYCLLCLELNNEMDIAYDLLAQIEQIRSGDWDQVLEYRARALALSPGSAEYHLDLAVTFGHLNRLDAAAWHLREAKKIYPEIRKRWAEHVIPLEKRIKRGN